MPNPASQNIAKSNNKILAEDLSVHNWYRFVLSFPPHLVREYLERFDISARQRVLDPFCGTGTTLVECKKLGITCAGIEANPMACFASRVKLDWEVEAEPLLQHARRIAEITSERLAADGFDELDDLPLIRSKEKNIINLKSLPENLASLLLNNSISPIPLHKTLTLLQTMEEQKDERFYRYERLALAKAVVCGISNLRFGPEVGVGIIKSDAPVVKIWLDYIRTMVHDLRNLNGGFQSECRVYQADARNMLQVLPQNSVDAVITSPPYPNEKDYTRTTRLESVLLGFIKSKQDLRSLKKYLVRSNTRGVYKDDDDDLLVVNNEEIQRIANDIENRRVELGKTSGFERLYARVTRLYFGGMARHLSDLRSILCKDAKLAYVVGDQASYLRVKIKTGQILADLAKSLGYEVTGIDLYRTRLATATKEQLREEVVLLRWPGHDI